MTTMASPYAPPPPRPRPTPRRWCWTRPTAAPPAARPASPPPAPSAHRAGCPRRRADRPPWRRRDHRAHGVEEVGEHQAEDQQHRGHHADPGERAEQADLAERARSGASTESGSVGTTRLPADGVDLVRRGERRPDIGDRLDDHRQRGGADRSRSGSRPAPGAPAAPRSAARRTRRPASASRAAPRRCRAARAAPRPASAHEPGVHEPMIARNRPMPTLIAVFSSPGSPGAPPGGSR